MNDAETKPDISLRNKNSVKATHPRLGDYYLYFQTPKEKWFTENVTNKEKVMGVPNKSPFVKDAFHSALIKGENLDALKKKKNGTKFSPVYKIRIEGGKTESIYLRLSNKVIANPFTLGFKKVFEVRKEEANAIL